MPPQHACWALCCPAAPRTVGVVDDQDGVAVQHVLAHDERTASGRAGPGRAGLVETDMPLRVHSGSHVSQLQSLE